MLVECLILFTPEGELKDIVAICKYLVKGTTLADDCTYLEKSKVGVRGEGSRLGLRGCLQRAVQAVRLRTQGYFRLLHGGAEGCLRRHPQVSVFLSPLTPRSG